MDLDAMRRLGSEPIAGPAPAGESVRYNPDFEALANEIEKLTSVEQTAVDWNRVVELGSGLLKKGKDLLVASYLTCGLLERRGYEGLATGCAILHGLLDNFWDGLFPELRRLRARIAAFDWLAARLEKVLAQRSDADEGDRKSLESAIADLDAILAANAKFDGESPSLGPALRALRGKLDSIPRPVEPERKPDPVAAAAAASGPAATSAPPPPPRDPEPDDPAAVAAALAKMRARQVAYAAVLRTADDADPRAYSLLREALWSDVVASSEGPASPVGDKSVLAPLQASLENGEYARALERAEALLPQHPLWLDLQLVAVNAFDGLGRRHARARQAVLESLAFLLRRCAGLAEASNTDGKALAARETRVWLANEVLPAASEPAADGLANVASEARKLVARGKLGDAMRLLTARVDATASRRGRFVLRLDLAKLCIEAGRLDLAVPQLEQLDKEVTHFSLEEWEPDLATAVVRSLWQCCAGQKPPPSLANRGQDIYARLCRLDPAAAVSAIGPQGA